MLLPVLSPLLVAIVLGILLGNLVPNLPETFMPGLNFAAKPLLRLGIVALGAQVVLGDILDLGWLALVLAAVIVAAGILSALALAKPLKVDRPLAVLIGSGFGICGAAAVAGIESTLKSKKEDVAAAIGLVVLFGTLMIAIVPSLSTAMGLSPETAGMWGGAATHEVAQVVAIGGIIGPAALEIAVLVKLARVIMLAPTVAVFSYAVRRSEAKAMTTGTEAAPGSGATNHGRCPLGIDRQRCGFGLDDDHRGEGSGADQASADRAALRCRLPRHGDPAHLRPAARIRGHRSQLGADGVSGHGDVRPRPWSPVAFAEEPRRPPAGSGRTGDDRRRPPRPRRSRPAHLSRAPRLTQRIPISGRRHPPAARFCAVIRDFSSSRTHGSFTGR